MFTKNQGAYTCFFSALNADFVLLDCSPRFKAFLTSAHRKAANRVALGGQLADILPATTSIFESEITGGGGCRSDGRGESIVFGTEGQQHLLRPALR